MAKLLELLGVAALAVTALAFGAWCYLFYTAPEKPDPVNTEHVYIYMSTANKTVDAYMSPTKRQIYDALGNTHAISFVSFFVLMFAAGWLRRKQNKTAR